MYTKDAVVLAPGSQPVNGRQAIGQVWEDLLKPGNRKDHTFEIVSIQQDGQYAYQVARFTLNIINKAGEPTKVSGNTFRIFERQPDGGWLTKVHIFNRHQNCKAGRHSADAKAPKVVIDVRHRRERLLKHFEVERLFHELLRKEELRGPDV